jgi:hypothetical protein
MVGALRELNPIPRQEHLSPAGAFGGEGLTLMPKSQHPDQCRRCAEEVTTPGPAGKVVIRYTNGRLTKGYSYDFAAGRRRFHIFPEPDASSEPTPILLSELKAVFFVREFAGKAEYVERKRFADGQHLHGRAIEVKFHDGEVLVGSTTSDTDTGLGVLFTPADPASNNVLVYAVSSAVRQIRDLPPPRPAALPVRRLRSAPPLPRGWRAWLQQPVVMPWSRQRYRSAQ